MTNYFYDDPAVPYAPLPKHGLDRSPCYPIISLKQGEYYCKLRPEIKNVHLESIEHHTIYKDPAAHESDLLKCPEITHEWIIL
jgi:hypothetical protein